MARTFTDQGLIVAVNEEKDDALYVVFLVEGRGFFAGLLTAGRRKGAGKIEAARFARIVYRDPENNSGIYVISRLQMSKKKKKKKQKQKQKQKKEGEEEPAAKE